MFEKTVKEVNISATKSSKLLNALPIPTTLIREKEITETGASKLDEVISKQTGIINVSTKTGTEGLQMQGLDASYTAILLDGCPIIGRSFGTLDLNRISVADIEKIEIATEVAFQDHFVEAMAIPHKTANYPFLSSYVDLPQKSKATKPTRKNRRTRERN